MRLFVGAWGVIYLIAMGKYLPDMLESESISIFQYVVSFNGFGPAWAIVGMVTLSPLYLIW